MKLKFLSMALIAMMAVSCGGKKDSSYSVKAEDATVGGTLGEYVALKTGDYTILTNNDNSISMTVTFEVKALPSDKKIQSYSIDSKIILLDENKSPLGVELDLKVTDKDELATALENGSAKLSLKFEEYDRDAVEIVSKAKYIEASVSGKFSDPNEESGTYSVADEPSNDSEVSEASSSVSNADIDAWIDKYERLMNTYVSLAKKAKNGDMSAINEYASYASQLNELYSDLENVSANMTPAQTSRLARIYAKMASATY